MSSKTVQMSLTGLLVKSLYFCTSHPIDPFHCLEDDKPEKGLLSSGRHSDSSDNNFRHMEFTDNLINAYKTPVC